MSYKKYFITVVDSSGKPVPFSVTVNDTLDGYSIASDNYSAGETADISIDLNFPLDRYGLAVYAEGKAIFASTFDEIFSQTDRVQIVMKKPGGGALPLLLIGGAGLYLLSQKKKSKVGAAKSIDPYSIILLGGGLIAFSVVKKIFEGIGLWDSQATKDLDNASSDPNSFWNPTYWQRAKPAGANWSYAITESTAKAWAKEIWDAIGPFDDCEECVITVFKRCRTKANASFLCDIFQRTYGQDLLTWLRGGIWPKDRLSDSDVATINNFISQLPAY